MQKLGGFMKNWKRRFFVLQKKQLDYYEDESTFQKGKSSSGSVSVAGAQLSIIPPDVHRRDFAFGVTAQGQKRTYVCIAENEESRRQWMAALKGEGALMDDLPEAAVVTVSPFSQKEGFLVKKGGIVKSWHNRYFILESDALHYYKNCDAESTTTPLGSIPLAEAEVKMDNPAEGFPGHTCFSLLCRSNGRKYMFLASDLAGAKSWIAALQENINAATSAGGVAQRSPTSGSVSTMSTTSSAGPASPSGPASPTRKDVPSATANGAGKEVHDESFFENVWPKLRPDEGKMQSNGVTMGWLLRWDDRDRDEDPSRYWKRRWVVLARATRTLRCWLTKEDAHPKSGVKPLKTFLLQGASITPEPLLQCARCVSPANPQGGDVVIAVSVLKNAKGSSPKLSKPMFWAAPSADSCKLWLSALEACTKETKKPDDDSDDEDGDVAPNDASRMSTVSAGGPGASSSQERKSADPSPESTSRAPLTRGKSIFAVNPEAFKGNVSSPEVAQRVMRRLLSLEQQKGAQEAEAQERARKDADIKELVTDWLAVCDKDICMLLQTLHDIFPAAPRAPDNLSQSSDPAEVKKAYHAAIKFVHPDKLEDPSMGEKLLSEAVFEALNICFKQYQSKQ